MSDEDVKVARAILDELDDRTLKPAEALAAAQVYALLALVEAIQKLGSGSNSGSK